MRRSVSRQEGSAGPVNGVTDGKSGKPYHLIGLELGVSIASIMLRGEPTGQTQTWAGDVIATAKRDLKAGEKLDGEGGYTVYGKLVPAEESLRIEGLPIGLAHGFTLKKDKKQGEGLSWQDVEFDEKSQAVKIRREMEDVFRKEFGTKGKSSANGANGSHGANGVAVSGVPG